MLPELGYEQHSFQFQPGDLLAIYSDGVTEAENADDEEYGEERLAKLLEESRGKPSGEIVEEVFRSLTEWTGDGQGKPATDA